MKYRPLGKTGLQVSEIGFGAEWMERHKTEEVVELLAFCEENGINLLDCWMSDPKVRDDLGTALKGRRDKWIIQGHFGSTWQDNQYTRTRDMEKTKEAFLDLMTRLGTDYIDIGMIHFVDQVDEFHKIMEGEYYSYVKDLKDKGVICHIGMSTHNPEVALLAAKSGLIEVLMFSINPAFDMLPPTSDMTEYFKDNYDENLGGIAPERAELYRLCEGEGVGLTVMKGYGGGRLFNKETSPFGVALTPIHCIHYALTRPGVSSILAGFDTIAHVEDALAYERATSEEKDFATIIAHAPYHSYSGQCTYCGHCQPCPSEIEIAMVNKYADLASMQTKVPDSVKDHYLSLNAHASDCIECGQCEERCPFDVEIIEKMKETVKMFGR